ncbi:MAG: DUF4625 domain-containing protein [Tannerellaceae bacterium]|jgi:hypothetical protein|nr:DUF4625 domain-containing protein [Tannerellaceae bacterium]
MKVYSYILIFCLTAIFPLSTVSCDKDGDTVKPVINLIEPAEGDVLVIGEDVHFEMELSDNEMLKEYKVGIHHNFDGHSHSATRADLEPFLFEKVWDVSGKKNTSVHHHEIVIPTTAAPGDYHLEVYCTDAAGNEAYIVRNVELAYEGGDHDHDHEGDD